jgi:penicillin amidase
MPHLADPEIGFVATANAKPTLEGEGPFLSVDWVDGYRQARIVEALKARQDWDLINVLALQVDEVSIPWRELRDAVLALHVGVDDARQALTMLEEWDGVISAGSPAASVFEFFVAEMVQRIARAKAPRAAQWALGKGFTPLVPRNMFTGRRIGHLVRLVREQPLGWFERSWQEEMADGLAAAFRALRERHGADPNRWAWGRVRPLTLQHSVGGQAPLDRVFNLGPFAWGGDGNTVAQTAVNPADPTANPRYIASLRMVVDVGDWEESRFVLPGGQSGNPVSPHYDDQLALWQRGEGVPIAWSPEKVVQASRTLLRLEPNE